MLEGPAANWRCCGPGCLSGLLRTKAFKPEGIAHRCWHDSGNTRSEAVFKAFPICIVTISSSAGELGVDRGRGAVADWGGGKRSWG
jgi:uncharacterized protein (DUF983 family)